MISVVVLSGIHKNEIEIVIAQTILRALSAFQRHESWLIRRSPALDEKNVCVCV